MPNLSSNEKVDRLAILVSGAGVEKHLGVPKIKSGTGEAQANAVIETLEDWDLLDKVNSMSFDVVASHTGKNSGACKIIETKLQKNLYNLACLHHILELRVAAVFDDLFGAYCGPNITLFEKFKKDWNSFDHKKWKSGMEDKKICNFLKPIRNELITFIEDQLKEYHPREDYKELLQLCLLFLGKKSNINIRAPGACHRARWLSKLI